MKQIIGVIVTVCASVACIVGYAVTHETIPAGYVGYVYDRTATAEDNVIPGTSVLNTGRTGRISINPLAQNEVELAKLERDKQDEINQQIVDAQKAQSEKELLQRQTEADAKAYEITREAEANLAAQEAELKIAASKVEQARLEKEAELEKQKSFTDEYFRDKELDVQKEAVKAINGSVKTIITSGDGEGYGALFGIKEVLNNIEE